MKLPKRGKKKSRVLTLKPKRKNQRKTNHYGAVLYTREGTVEQNMEEQAP